MPMIYQVRDRSSNPINAHLNIDPLGIDFHARGGPKVGGINSDYAQGLELVLERMKSANIALSAIWVNSNVTKSLPLEDKLVITNEEFNLQTSEILRLISTRSRAVGKKPGSKGGNSTKRLRIQFASTVSDDLVDIFKLTESDRDEASESRLSASELRQVTSDHLHVALALLQSGVETNFSDSKEYDVVLGDGERYPPKALFGLALSIATGTEAVPENFSGGEDSTCFSVLRENGFSIRKKDEEVDEFSLSLTDEERAWAEGKPKWVKHLKRERKSGLAQAKKTAFIKEHRRLYCERCGLVPTERYGELGDACIEVHHHKVAVSEMGEGHQTSLDDLQCLCANCHRIVHRELKS